MTTPLDPAANAEAGNEPAEENPQDIWKELDAADDALKSAASSEGSAPAAESGAEHADDWAVDGAQDPDPAAADGAGAPDIWANATPEQRAAYEELAQKYKSVNGRVAPLQRRLEELRAQATKERPERKSPTAAIAALKDDYPEIAEPLLEALAPIEEALQEQDQIEESRRTAAVQELETLETEAQQELEKVHPDWLETLGQNGEVFAAWIEDQPRRIRQAAYENANGIVDAAQASEVVQLFKAHLAGEPPREAATDPQDNRNSLEDRRARQLGASMQPSGRGPNRPLRSGIPESGDPEQLWAMWEQVDRQKAAQQAGHNPYR